MNPMSKLTASLTLSAALLVPATSFAQLEEIIVTAQKRSESLQDVPIAIQALTGEQLDSYNADSAEDILGLFPNLSINGSNEVNKGFTIRGVGTNNFHGNVNRAVGIYQDDVSLGTPFTGVLGVYDVERVEILRGPQNSLFGRNTTGGAINYVSRLPQPGEEPSGYFRGTLGSYNQTDVEAAIGASLTDTIAVRASLQSVKRNGLFVNLAPGREGEELGAKRRISARIQALWVGDSSSILLNYHVGKNSGTNAGNRSSGLIEAGAADAFTEPNPFTITDYCDVAVISATRSHDGVTNACTDHRGFNPSLQPNGEVLQWNQIYNVTSAVQDVDISGGFVKVAVAFESGMELTSISAIENTNVLQADDNGGTNLISFVPNQDADYKQLSQEIRLASSQDKSFRWIGGLYYFQEDLLLGTHVINNSGAGGRGVLASNILDQRDEDSSLYGQIEWDFSEKLTLTAGLRYTSNTKTADSTFRVSHLGGPPPLAPETGPINTFSYLADNPTTLITNEYVIRNTHSAPAVTNIACNPGPMPAPRTNLLTGAETMAPAFARICAFPNLRQELKEFGGKIGLDWKINDASLLYGSYSRGFKSGGFDTRALVALNPNADAREPVKKETLDAFEVGYKSTFASGKLQLNAAIFYYLWNDLQTFVIVEGVPGFANVPKSTLYGLEAEVHWAPTETWLVTASVGFLNTEVTDVGNLGASLDKGHTLPNSPEFSFNASVLKDFPIGEGRFTVQADVRYVSDQIDGFLFDQNPDTGAARTPIATIDSLHTKPSQLYLNMRVGYTTPGEDFEVTVWAENLTQERFCNDLGTLGTLNFVNQCSPAEGQRLFGVTGKVNF